MWSVFVYNVGYTLRVCVCESYESMLPVDRRSIINDLCSPLIGRCLLLCKQNSGFILAIVVTLNLCFTHICEFAGGPFLGLRTAPIGDVGL